MLSYIDTHAHLSMLGNDEGRPGGGLEDLFGSGFGAVLDVGTKADDLPARLEAFGRFPGVHFSAGVWPSAEAIARRAELVAELEARIDAAVLAGARLAAVGECGMDRRWNVPAEGSDAEGEAELFAAQAAAAKKRGLALIVHSRDAAAETADVLKSVAGVRGVIHCFSYGREEARTFLDLGFFISFSGVATYPKADGLRDAARYVPQDRILLETDAPYLAPSPLRGKPCRPSMIAHTYRAVAELRGVGEEDLVGTVAANAKALFGMEVSRSR